MAFSVSRKKGINVFRVVGKLIGTLIALWAGGVILTSLGSVMNGTCSPFYQGLTLIGWGVETGDAGASAACVGEANTIYTTSGSGILAVIGIIGIASVVLEFVDIKM